MKSVIYSRVSTEIQDFTRQNDDIKEYCEKNNIQIVKEFSEKESGKKEERTELTNMLNFVKSEKIDFCIVHELSRLGRTGEVIHTIEKLNDLNVCLISLKENLRTLNPDLTPNPTSSLILKIMSSVNNFELDTFKYRSKSGLRNNAKNGKGTGSRHLAYGYTTDDNNTIIIDVEESNVVKRIFNLFLSGWGTRKIAVLLNQEGILTKNSKPARGVYHTKEVEVSIKKWTEGVIYQILNNPFYTGKRKYMKEIHSVPVIIDETTQLKVKEILKSKRNYETKNKKYDFLLNERLVKCGVCGKNYYPKYNKIEHRYQCRSKRDLSGNCGNVGVKIEKLDRAVNSVVLSFFPSFLLKKQDNTQIVQDLKYFEILYNNNLSNIKEVEKKEQKLLDLYLNDSISKNIFNERADELKKNKERFLNENQSYLVKIDDLKETISKRSNYSEVIKSINKNGITKTLLRKIVSKVVIDKSDIQLAGEKITNKTLKVSVFVDEYFVSFLMTQQSQHIKIVEVYDGKKIVRPKEDGINVISDETRFYELMKGVR